MSAPYADFPASQATVDLGTGKISYEAAGQLAASGKPLGQAITAANTVAKDAILTAPARLLGAGAAAALVGGAILFQVDPLATEPDIAIPFNGGQQSNRDYNVAYTFKLRSGGRIAGNFFPKGPVGNVQSRQFDAERREWFVIAGGVFVSILIAARDLVEEIPRIVSVTPTDGFPDTPQNPAPDWVSPGFDDIPNYSPVDIVFSPTVTIPVTPTVYPSPKQNPGLQPQQPVSPGFDVYFPEIGVNINFSPTGVGITFTMPSPSPTQYPPAPSTYPPIRYPQNPCLCDPVDVSEVLCRLEKLQGELLDDGYNFFVTGGPSGDSGTASTGADELYMVELDITLPTVGAKVEPGNANAPRIVYSGWLAFRVRGRWLPRQPIHYDLQGYLAPAGAEGYSFTVTLGGTAVSRYVTRRRKPYVDNC